MLDWYEEMSVGVQELDEQHRHLFSMVNAILVSIKTKDHTANDFWVSLSNLADYAVYHLTIEEEYMEKYGCGTQAHLDAHAYFRKQMKEFMERAETARHDRDADIGKFAEEMAWFAGHWHVEHILVMDKGYTQCFHQHGVY